MPKEPTSQRDEPVGGFVEWIKRYYPNRKNQSAEEIVNDFPFSFKVWQEATKQRDAQYELMAEHTELSIREDAVIGERERTKRALNNILLAHEGITLTKGVIATWINIIEKESE